MRAVSSARARREKEDAASPLRLLLPAPPTTTTHTHTHLQNNAAFENLAKAGGPSMSALLSGPPSDLKKLLLFHVSPTKVEQDVELAPGKTLDTKLPGAKLQSVLAPEGKGVNIKPSSYAGKSVGPAGAGEQLIFFSSSEARPRPRHLEGKKAEIHALFSLFSLFSLSSFSLSSNNQQTSTPERPPSSLSTRCLCLGRTM